MSSSGLNVELNHRLKIAIIGGGAAGISAAHRLSQDHQVTLFESAKKIGGHANPVSIEGGKYQVDTGFLIFNDTTYPTFCAFLKDIGVFESALSAEMSSCFSNREGRVHYSLGQKKKPIVFQWNQWLEPKFYQIFRDLLRFRKQATRDLKEARDLRGVTIKGYLGSYSLSFKDNFVYPLTAAVWSLPPDKLDLYPAQNILDYFNNHQLLSGKSDRRWLSFKGSSQVYLNAFQDSFKGQILTGCKVASVIRGEKEATVHFVNREAQTFDHVIFATPADISLKLLASPTQDEKRLLSPWLYNASLATLHTDTQVLHENQKLWSSWNMKKCTTGYHISYLLNRVQQIPSNQSYILSLGDVAIDESKILSQFKYRHPIFSHGSVATQQELFSLNSGLFAFCGSYFGHGFHEDAFASGLRAAQGIAHKPA